MALTDADVREILRIIDESDLTELRIETEEFSLHVRRGAGSGDAFSERSRAGTERSENASRPPAHDQTPHDGHVTIDAPMLGTFYRAEAPGEQPFVQPGNKVGPDTIVCIIEVMKMMNSIPAGVSGVVTEVLAENAELVEYGAPLFRVKPQ